METRRRRGSGSLAKKSGYARDPSGFLEGNDSDVPGVQEVSSSTASRKDAKSGWEGKEELPYGTAQAVKPSDIPTQVYCSVALLIGPIHSHHAR